MPELRFHAIRRTSAPGAPWLGTCQICHTVGMAQYQAGEYCPGRSEKIEGYGTPERLGGVDLLGMGGKGRRQVRDRAALGSFGAEPAREFDWDMKIGPEDRRKVRRIAQADKARHKAKRKVEKPLKKKLIRAVKLRALRGK